MKLLEIYNMYEGRRIERERPKVAHIPFLFGALCVFQILCTSLPSSQQSAEKPFLCLLFIFLSFPARYQHGALSSCLLPFYFLRVQSLLLSGVQQCPLSFCCVAKARTPCLFKFHILPQKKRAKNSVDFRNEKFLQKLCFETEQNTRNDKSLLLVLLRPCGPRLSGVLEPALVRGRSSSSDLIAMKRSTAATNLLSMCACSGSARIVWVI